MIAYPTRATVCCALALAALAGCSEVPRREPLRRVSECLNTSSAFDWQKVEDDQIIVKSHARSFRIRLTEPCRALDTAIAIRFGKTLGSYVCGNIGEVLIAGSQSCGVLSVEPIAAPAAGTTGKP